MQWLLFRYFSLVHTYFVIKYFDSFVGEEGADCWVFVGFQHVCSMVVICLSFLIVTLVGYVRWFWLFYTTVHYTRRSNDTVPFIMHVGSVLLQLVSAWHIRVVAADRVYPVSQLNVASDRYVVPLEYDTEPFDGAVIAPQSVMKIKSLTIVLLKTDMPCLCKQFRSRAIGFWRSKLSWIYSVSPSGCEFMSISTTWIE